MYRELVGREWPDVVCHLTDPLLPPLRLKAFADEDGAVARQLAQVDAVKAAPATAPAPVAGQPYPKAEQAARSPQGTTRKPVRGLAPASRRRR